jgi:hypothetical protein
MTESILAETQMKKTDATNQAPEDLRTGNESVRLPFGYGNQAILEFQLVDR